MAADYYAILGVGREAGPDEIKRAYRRLARELHPDANPGDPAAEARFKEVAVAYEVLADPERRRRYDLFGADEAGGGGGDPFTGFGGGFGDLFDAFFTGFGGGPQAGPMAGPDLEATVELSFEEAVFGAEAPVAIRTAVGCAACEATGAAPGTSPTTCPDCGGTGQVRRVRQSILGQMVTAGACQRCGSLGSIVDQPCPECDGDGRLVREVTYTVEIPAGIEDGRTLRLGGRGAAGPRGGAHGDLYLHVRVRPHDRFVRQGYDLHHDLHVSMAQAALGVTVPLETLDGTEELTVPRGTQSGLVLRLRGRGVPVLEGRGRGDLKVRVVVDTPVELTDEEEAELRAWAERRGESVAPPDAGFLAKIRSAFK